MIYAGYSKGFKSGGYSLNRMGFSHTVFGGNGPSADDLEFDAETVNAYELGWNSSWMDSRIRVNGALFYHDISDFQSLIFDGTSFSVVVADATSKGLELDLLAQVTEKLSLQAGYAHTEAQNEETGIVVSAQPEGALSFAATFSTPVGESLFASLYLFGRYASEQRLATDLYQDAFTLVNARISIGSVDGPWELSIFGKNLTDEDYGIIGFGLPQQSGSIGQFPSVPRMYGAELRFDY